MESFERGTEFKSMAQLAQFRVCFGSESRCVYAVFTFDAVDNVPTANPLARVGS